MKSKNFNKIEKLAQEMVIPEQALAMVIGGFSPRERIDCIGGARFACRCNGAGNPPYVREWTGYYCNVSEILQEVDKRCASSGSCMEIL